jgi:Bacterial Ig domain
VTAFGGTADQLGLSKFQILGLGTIIDDNIYHLRYSADASQFSKYYGEVQQIIRSIKFMQPEKQPIAYNGIVKVESGSNIILHASDPGNRSLTFSIVKQPSKGALLLSKKNSTTVNATYFPSAGRETGKDSFSYKVNNGILDSKIANVSVTFVPKPLQGPENTTSNTQNDNVSSLNQETNVTDLESSSNNTSNAMNPEPTSSNPAKIEILFFNVDHTSGYIFNTNWVAWGEVETGVGVHQTQFQSKLIVQIQAMAHLCIRTLFQ